MKCRQCGINNSYSRKTCCECGSILEGVTVNNVNGKVGYRHKDGTFTEFKQSSTVFNNDIYDKLQTVLKGSCIDEL